MKKLSMRISSLKNKNFSFFFFNKVEPPFFVKKCVSRFRSRHSKISDTLREYYCKKKKKKINYYFKKFFKEIVFFFILILFHKMKRLIKSSDPAADCNSNICGHSKILYGEKKF